MSSTTLVLFTSSDLFSQQRYYCRVNTQNYIISWYKYILFPLNISPIEKMHCVTRLPELLFSSPSTAGIYPNTTVLLSLHRSCGGMSTSLLPCSARYNQLPPIYIFPSQLLHYHPPNEEKRWTRWRAFTLATPHYCTHPSGAVAAAAGGQSRSLVVPRLG